MNASQISWFKHKLDLIKTSPRNPRGNPIIIGQIDGALVMVDPEYRTKYSLGPNLLVKVMPFFPWCKPRVRPEDWAEKVVRLATEYVAEQEAKGVKE